MNFLKLIFQSSLGKKYLMALTGLALWLFVIGHLVGNLQIFLGEDAINQYAHFLKSQPALLWGARLGLLACVGIHIYCAVTLTLENRRARGAKGYDDDEPCRATYASRTMAWSGVIVFSFILFHLAHFTVGWVDGNYLEYEDSLGRHDVYRMVVTGFSYWTVSAFYIVSMALLCLHLSHGTISLFQSLGIRTRANAYIIDRVALYGTALIFVGNCAIPLSILAGWVR